ncbi:patatin-like phospholipase [Legionella beliardensis]|uniref:Patatin-like phospholipase n=1 Tax=Legionella beliardensis TaxID=91822 RepID=A0A378JTX1_9GAMM|nr:patatin-like phospholipase family protein [Legionella beliardensis]STX55720.1 patatin-like phospholipase [Legionella beliardensis]
MNKKKYRSVRTKKSIYKIKRPPFECVALVLQGGGALGSYQAGVYEALDEVGLYPDWVAGISIGAVNAAIIAGNPVQNRVAQLKLFWETICTNSLIDWSNLFTSTAYNFEFSLFNQASAWASIINGVPNFFMPRNPAPFFYPDGAIEATSFYDLTPLKATLEQFVDFNRINNEPIRFSVGAVNVTSGNFTYFDNTTHKICLEHIIASASLPPGFSATEINGEFYWDGGLISNTPLEWVVEGETRQDTLAFQVDLWNAQGSLPRNIAETMTRQKEIQYSSRTRASTTNFQRLQSIRCVLVELLSKLPPHLSKSKEAKFLEKIADHKVYNIVQLIHRPKYYEGHAKDYEFSLAMMREHWKAGYVDTMKTLQYPEIFIPPNHEEGVLTFDLS